MAPAPAAAQFLRRAIALAERGWGRVHPNPLVGAVVVRDGQVVGEGFHGEYGGPHAEVVALAAAGERAHGATLYVTLEPCTHRGKTPPCTEAVRAAGIERVVYGAEDPHPQAGGGGDRLRAWGIEVLGSVEREAVRAQNAPFFHAVERGTAYVALKYGLSLDARLAEGPGQPTTVTGAAAHAAVHRLRAGFDAILVGSNTVRTDDPLLTVRGAVAPRRPPVRVVLDSSASLSLDSRLVRTVGSAPLWVVCAEDAPAPRRRALEAAGARVLAVPRAPGGVAIEATLERLRGAGIESLLCEGGGRIGGALLAADVVERLYLFIAPRLFGETGVAAFPGRPDPVKQGWRLVSARELDGDAALVLDRRRAHVHRHH